MAPIIELMSMAPRASTSWGLATARARFAAPSRSPSRAMPSQMGL